MAVMIIIALVMAAGMGTMAMVAIMDTVVTVVAIEGTVVAVGLGTAAIMGAVIFAPATVAVTDTMAKAAASIAMGVVLAVITLLAGFFVPLKPGDLVSTAMVAVMDITAMVVAICAHSLDIGSSEGMGFTSQAKVS